jgi:DegV family protein with EDD domain
MPGGGTRVVTDSLAWIPDDLVRQHNIKVVPLHVHFGEEQFTETVDLTNEQFYTRLRESKELPKTSAPSPGEFMEAYREVAADAGAIVSIHFTSKLSATYRSAEIAAGELRQEFPNLEIETLDTLQAAMAQGIVVLRAAEQASKGVPFEQIVADAKALIPKPRVYFVVETLEYLHKGGRIGGAAAFLGGLLNVKPILTVANGEVARAGRERTRTRAMEKLCDTIADYAKGRPLAHLSVIHAVAEDSARELARMIESRFTVEGPTIYTELGPVIGTYVGPGAFGATFHCD